MKTHVEKAKIRGFRILIRQLAALRRVHEEQAPKPSPELRELTKAISGTVRTAHFMYPVGIPLDESVVGEIVSGLPGEVPSGSVVRWLKWREPPR